MDGAKPDSYPIDWGKVLPRCNQFKPQEQASKVVHGISFVHTSMINLISQLVDL